MSSYYFIDLKLRVETFFKKEGAAETEGVNFEIGDIGTSTHLHRRVKKIACTACLLLKALRESFFCFPDSNWNGAVPKVLNTKYRSEFKHGFTNRGCLHCAIL